MTEFLERRIYYTNEGNEIHVNVLIKRLDAKGVEVDIAAKEMYVCHGYTQLASREDYLNPNASDHKVILTAEYDEIDKTGNVIKTYKNMENILKDDYIKLDVNQDEALSLAKEDSKIKIIGVWLDSEGKVGHSAIVNPQATYSDYPFIAKFGDKEFEAVNTGQKKNSEYNEQTFTFGGFYQYTGDKQIDISTVKGKTNLSSDEVKSKIE